MVVVKAYPRLSMWFECKGWHLRKMRGQKMRGQTRCSLLFWRNELGYVPSVPVFLTFDIVQHPYAARRLFHEQRQPMLSNRKLGALYPLRNHPAGFIKCGDRKWRPNRCSLGWIEMNSPNIEEAAATGEKVNRLSVRRPAWLIVPMLPLAKPNPWSTCRGCHVQYRIYARGCIGGRLKGNPSPIWRKVCLEKVA